MKIRRQTKYIVVHTSATKPGSDIGADEIDDWHKRRGWSGIGYADVVRLDASIEFGRHHDAVGAHVAGKNFQSVGVCLVGGLDKDGKPADTFSANQLESLRWLIAVLTRAYPGAEVLGHRDLSPDLDGDGIVERHEWLKECPCFDVRKWLKTGDR